MEKPKNLQELKQFLDKKIPEILGLEMFSDGTDNQLCIRDEDDEIIESIDFSDEVKEIKQLISDSLTDLLEGLRETVINSDASYTTEEARKTANIYKAQILEAIDTLLKQTV